MEPDHWTPEQDSTGSLRPICLRYRPATRFVNLMTQYYQSPVMLKCLLAFDTRSWRWPFHLEPISKFWI